MKSRIYLSNLVALLCLQSCGGGLIKHKDGDSSQTSTASHSKISVPNSNHNLVVNNEKDLIGYWVGQFGPDIPDTVDYYGDEEFNKINIVIDEINNNKVSGHTVMAGKVRAFKCTMVDSAATYIFTFQGGANEKDYGTFKFGISKGDTLIDGRWDSTQKKARRFENAARYKLTKHLFEYSPNWKLTTETYKDESKRKKLR